MEQWIKRILPHKRRASPTSQYPDSPYHDAPPHTTTAIDVPSTSISRPLSVSPAQGTSRVDLVQSNVIANQQPLTVPGPTGIGEHIGLNQCIDRYQPGSQIITPRFSLATGRLAILQREEACTRSWHSIQQLIYSQDPTSTSASFQARESLPSDSPPIIANYTPRSDVAASQTTPRELLSQVEQTLAVCPR